MEEFNFFILETGLIELPIQGNAFTWLGTNEKCSKLDRFLFNAEWMDGCSWGPIIGVFVEISFWPLPYLNLKGNSEHGKKMYYPI